MAYPGYQLQQKDYDKIEKLSSGLITEDDYLAAEIGIKTSYLRQKKATDPKIKQSIIKGLLKLKKKCHYTIIQKALDPNHPCVELLKLVVGKLDSVDNRLLTKEITVEGGQQVRAIATSRPIIAQIQQETSETEGEEDA